MISHTRDDTDLGGSLNSLTKDFQKKTKGKKVCRFPPPYVHNEKNMGWVMNSHGEITNL